MAPQLTESCLAVALQEQLRPRGARARLARSLDVPAQTVSGWVTGRRTPSIDDLIRIEQALDVTPGTLTRHLGVLPVDTDPDPEASTPESAIVADRSIPSGDKHVLLEMLARIRERGA